MDEADQAERYIEREREASIARARTAAVEPPLRDGDGLARCLDCKVVIPAARLVAAPWAGRCAPCQARREQRV
jgi:phage/conjugal plasmid C-4 type zinc finger TraR family protein